MPAWACPAFEVLNFPNPGPRVTPKISSETHHSQPSPRNGPASAQPGPQKPTIPVLAEVIAAWPDGRWHGRSDIGQTSLRNLHFATYIQSRFGDLHSCSVELSWRLLYISRSSGSTLKRGHRQPGKREKSCALLESSRG